MFTAAPPPRTVAAVRQGRRLVPRRNLTVGGVALTNKKPLLRGAKIPELGEIKQVCTYAKVSNLPACGTRLMLSEHGC